MSCGCVSPAPVPVFYAMPFQDILHRVRCHNVTNISQCALYAVVTQDEFSLAMRSIKSVISSATRGRPIGQLR